MSKKSLYNKKNKDQLLKDLQKENFNRVTVSFYKYITLDNLDVLRDELYASWSDLKILGRVYIAKEGINAQISVPDYNLDAFKSLLKSYKHFKNINYKTAVQEGLSFLKLAIKIKNEIVAYKISKKQYNMKKVGNHLDYKEFNSAIDNGAVVVDIRNYYEGEIGKFKNAIIPDIDRSEDLLPEVKKLLENHKNDKVLMYCTGGIRCEKASTFLKHKGFKNVYQLNGGIIEYTRQVKEKGLENKFLGKNFVFDHRRSESISSDVISNCHQCGEKWDNHVNCANEACHLLFIQCQKCRELYNHCCSIECQKINALPIEEQKRLRKGKRNSNKIFKKGRSKVLKYKKKPS